jgi:hypothetical protein
MSLSRLLAILLATLGLAALPATSFAQDDFVDEGIEFVDEEILDEDLWCDDDFVDPDDEEEFFDEEFAFEDDGTELRQVDDEFFDEEDPGFLGPDGEEFFDDEPSDDELLDDCEPVEDSGALAEVGQIVKPDVAKIVKKGFITAQIRVPGKATITSALTKGSKRLGHATQKAKKAGKFTIRIDLTKKGKKIVKSATAPLKLTLTAKVKPAKGKKVTRVVHLTV